MKCFTWILILFLLSSSVAIAQDNPAETIEFPTITNNENINLNDTVRCTNGEHPDSARQRKEHRRSVREIVKGKNFGFYTDIIIGAIVLIVGFIGWKVYNRFAPQHESDENIE